LPSITVSADPETSPAVWHDLPVAIGTDRSPGWPAAFDDAGS